MTPSTLAPSISRAVPIFEYCFGPVCFVPMSPHAPKLFGFAELLTGLALIVIAWTIADIRYRFRIRIAPLPLQKITFWVVALDGSLCLLSDLWRVKEWWVPVGFPMDSAEWQAFLAAVLLLTFLLWAWFAFIQPPVFGEWNAVQFGRALYRVILKGSPSELAEIGDELARSAKSLIRHASEQLPRHLPKEEKEEHWDQRPEVTAYADEILLLIADKRFCRALVQSASATVLAIFDEIERTRKFHVRIRVFGQNVVKAALINRDSFLYHETEGYESGLIGYHRPITQAMFGNYSMVEAIETLFDVDIWRGTWDADQWEAYCRIVLMTLEDKIETDFWSHSYSINRSISHIERSASDLYKLNGVSSSDWDSDIQKRLRVVVKFAKDVIKLLDRVKNIESIRLRSRKKHSIGTLFDDLANLIFEVIFEASAVRTPQDLSWWVQHNSVWHELFVSLGEESPAARIVRFKVRRLLFDEISGMRHWVNYKNGKILAFCLNVMGFKVRNDGYLRGTRALHKAVLSWTKKNFVALHQANPRVLDECLVERMTFDSTNMRLIKTYPADGLRKADEFEYLQLNNPADLSSSSPPPAKEPNA